MLPNFGKFLRWALDAAYPPGSDAWADNPNKYSPGDGDITQGWRPGEAPSAQWLNYWMNRADAHIAYLRTAEAQNWKPFTPVFQADDTSPLGPGSVYDNRLAWDPISGRLWIGGALDPCLRYSADGQFWTTETLPGTGNAITGIAIFQKTSAVKGRVVCTGSDSSTTAGLLFRHQGTGVWSAIDIGTDWDRLYGITWDPYLENLTVNYDTAFFFGRARAGSHLGMIGRAHTDAGGNTQATCVVNGAIASAITSLTFSGLASRGKMALDAAGNYYTAGSEIADEFTFQGQIDGHAVMGLKFVNGNWYAVTYNGACYVGGSLIPTSGSDWNVVTEDTDYANYHPYPNAFMARGGLMMFAATRGTYFHNNGYSSVNVIRWSDDNGKTWHDIPLPTPQISDDAALRLIDAGDRFGIVDYLGRVALSLRLR